ncbi:MAG: hypothetical protein WCH77_04830 [Planctomycetota bacterium]
MAKKTKSSYPSFDVLPADVLGRAKELLTAAEKKVFDSSFGAALSKATHAQVQAAAKHTRILRDKWRDLYESQTRAAKKAGRSAVASVNARTQDKHDLLAAAVLRFEKRLGELKTAVESAVAKAKPAAKAAIAKATVVKKAPAKASAKAPAKKAVQKAGKKSVSRRGKA